MASNEAILLNSEQRTANHNSALVSIIIPAYNTAKYIHRAIESSLRQTHHNVEVIVVDDGSSDETLSIAREYEMRDERVRVFTQGNAGVSAARNHAMREAKGEYLTFLDSDDWLEDKAVEVLLDAQMKYPDMMPVARFLYVWYDEDTKKCWAANYEPFKQEATLQSVSTEALTTMGSLGTGGMSPKLFAANKLKQHNIEFNMGVRYGEDTLFSFEYLCRMKGEVHINKFIYNYYHSSSVIHNPVARRVLGQSDMEEQMLKVPGLSEDVKKLIKIRKTGSRILNLSEGLAEGLNKDEIVLLRKSARKYMHEYLCASGNVKAKLLHKVLLCCLTLLPIPLARVIAKLYYRLWIRKMASLRHNIEAVEVSFR